MYIAGGALMNILFTAPVIVSSLMYVLGLPVDLLIFTLSILSIIQMESGVAESELYIHNGVVQLLTILSLYWVQLTGSLGFIAELILLAGM
jgi:phosphoribosylcarboxyaminoimidazole (NCAIR) mutase